jgi:hypothetical protein
MSTLQARQPLRKCNRPLVGVPASPIWKREVSRARGRRSKKTRASFSMHHQLYHKRIRVKPKEDPGLGCSPAPVQLSKNRFIRIVEVVLSKSNGDPTKSNGEGSARQTSLSRLRSSECRLTWSMMSRPGGAAFRGHQAPQHRVVPVLVGVELRNFRRIFGDDVVSGSIEIWVEKSQLRQFHDSQPQRRVNEGLWPPTRPSSLPSTVEDNCNDWGPAPRRFLAQNHNTRRPTGPAGERRAVAADQATESFLHSSGR